MYVDCLDLSTMDFTGTGGPPPTHKFAVCAWTINVVKAVLAADRVTDTKYGKLQVSSGFFAHTACLQIGMRQPSVGHKR